MCLVLLHSFNLTVMTSPCPHFLRMNIEDTYYQVRRAQRMILMRQYFRNGELYEIMNRKAFNNMADKLSQKYFHMAGSVIYKEMTELYRVYLCLAPIIQKQKNSFKLDWTKGNTLSWMRRLFNGSNKKWYYSHETVIRKHDVELFKSTLRNHGITDSVFIDFALEKYLCFWNADGRKGSLANCVFDPFFFKAHESGLRFENNLVHTSSSRKSGYKYVFDEPLEIMCYAISASIRSGRTHVDVQLSNNYLKALKERLLKAMEGKVSYAHKLVILSALVNSFIEDARYAKDAMEQVKDVQRYFIKHTKKFAAGNADFRHTAGAIIPLWLSRVTNRFTYQRTNFFWDMDHNTVPEKIYMIYFSPYREQI